MSVAEDQLPALQLDLGQSSTSCDRSSSASAVLCLAGDCSCGSGRGAAAPAGGVTKRVSNFWAPEKGRAARPPQVLIQFSPPTLPHHCSLSLLCVPATAARICYYCLKFLVSPFLPSLPPPPFMVASTFPLRRFFSRMQAIGNGPTVNVPALDRDWRTSSSPSMPVELPC